MRRAAWDRQATRNCGGWRTGHNGGDARRWKTAPSDRGASVLFIQRRLTALVGPLLADLGNLGAHLEHDPLD